MTHAPVVFATLPTDTAAFGGWIVLAYLLGSIPTGLLVARIKGVDIRKVGSGNIGATNVSRTLGKPWGILTFVGDALKGLVPALLFPKFAGADAAAAWGPAWAGSLGILSAMAAILGHNFSIFLRFKGGKGVATSAGALLGIAPAAVAIGLVVWALFFYTTRYVSLASIVAALTIPAAGWLLYRDGGPLLPWMLTVLGLLVIVRHKANIQRLLQGKEHRFEKKRKETTNEHQ